MRLPPLSVPPYASEAAAARPFPSGGWRTQQQKKKTREEEREREREKERESPITTP